MHIVSGTQAHTVHLHTNAFISHTHPHIRLIIADSVQKLSDDYSLPKSTTVNLLLFEISVISFPLFGEMTAIRNDAKENGMEMCWRQSFYFIYFQVNGI